MPPSTRKKQWRKRDDTEALSALRRKAAAAAVEAEGDGDFFEEDTGGRGVVPRRVAREVKKVQQVLKTTKADLEEGRRFAAAREAKRQAEQQKTKPFDLWGSAVLKGSGAAPLTKRVPEMPAVVVPKHGVSANPELGVWEDAVLEQAAISRQLLRLDETEEGVAASSSEEEEELGAEKDEPEVDVKSEPIPDTESAGAPPVRVPTDVAAKKKRRIPLQERRRLEKLQKRRALAKLGKIIDSVDRTNQQARNTIEYRAHLRAEERRLLAEGVLPKGEIKYGGRKYIETGDDVVLPGDLQRSAGSFRKLLAPETGSALRERAASFLKRGMVEFPTLRVTKKPNKKLFSRVRTH